MSIRPLPPEAAARIRSSCAITSLNGAVVGLVKNALDADATRIHISLDYARGNCTVDDDGEGIHPAEFRTSGALAKPNHTSRWPPDGTRHGFYGEFLAALAQTALMTVSSKHYNYLSHNAIVFHHAEPIIRHTPAPESLRFLVFEQGTRVAVQDLFGSLPVRAKQRAVTFGGSGGTWARDRERDSLVHVLVGLLLAWNSPPAGVEVWLRDEASRKTVRLRHPGNAPWDVTVGALVSQAKLADGADGWVRVRGALGGLSVCGAISLVPSPSKSCQFFSFGIHPLTPELGAGDLFNAVNSVFANSDFGLSGLESSATWSRRPLADDTRARKGVDRWPMFCLRLSMDSLDQRGPSWHALLDPGHLSQLARMATLVKTVCVEFLKKHSLRPKAVAQSRLKARPGVSRTSSSAVSAPVAARNPFDSWPVRKPGGVFTSQIEDKTTQILDGQSGADSNSSMTTQSTTIGPLIGLSGQLYRPPFLINGQPVGVNPPLARKPIQDPAPIQPGPPDPNWLDSILDQWENPVFEDAERPVPLIGTAAGEMSSSATRISRDALARALVVSQVDHKFILVKIRPNEGASASCLVLVDQHAADERVKLETLMEEYFPASGGDALTEVLDVPLRFELSAAETERLLGMKSWFRHWGVACKLNAEANECTVASLPPVIAGRCTQEPRLLVDLVRQALWRDADGQQYVGHSTNDSHSSHGTDDQHHACDSSSTTITPAVVSQRFHGCPAGILDLLNSRACRTAIMFNDVLSLEECQGLLARLIKCALPFQCAHGRPVLAPVVSLGGLARWRGDVGYSRATLV